MAATRPRALAGLPSTRAVTAICRSTRLYRLPRPAWWRRHLPSGENGGIIDAVVAATATDWPDGVVGGGVALERRPRCRQDRHADAQPERGGDSGRRHADADAQRRRHRDLYGGSGTSALTFSYTVGAGQNTAALAATAVNLNAATITDGAGNAANLSLSGLTQSGPQIDTTTPTCISAIAEIAFERRPQRRQDRDADARP